jgi:hypothetical protein
MSRHPREALDRAASLSSRPNGGGKYKRLGMLFVVVLGVMAVLSVWSLTGQYDEEERSSHSATPKAVVLPQRHQRASRNMPEDFRLLIATHGRVMWYYPEQDRIVCAMQHDPSSITQATLSLIHTHTHTHTCALSLSDMR